MFQCTCPRPRIFLASNCGFHMKKRDHMFWQRSHKNNITYYGNAGCLLQLQLYCTVQFAAYYVPQCFNANADYFGLMITQNIQPCKQLALSAAQVRLETTTRQAKTADSL